MAYNNENNGLTWGDIMFRLGLPLLALAVFVFMLCTKTVGSSRVGIVTTFGEVSPVELHEGFHVLSPLSNVQTINLSIERADAKNAEAASKDLQSVHSDLVVNYHVMPAKAVDLFKINTNLDYEDRIAIPSIYEAFKSVIARYSAEELISKRAEVSDAVHKAIGEKLAPYFLVVDNVSLVHFGFSKAFDEAIEQKVTASQQAETAKRNLEKVQYEAQQSIARAEGEAKAIAIQSSAIKENGGEAYLRLRAIEKWDGKMPQYNAGTLPFVTTQTK